MLICYAKPTSVDINRKPASKAGFHIELCSQYYFIPNMSDLIK